MTKPLMEILRETQQQIRDGRTDLDEAAAAIGRDPEIGLTETGARSLLGSDMDEVEQSFRRTFETARLEIDWLKS